MEKLKFCIQDDCEGGYFDKINEIVDWINELKKNWSGNMRAMELPEKDIDKQLEDIVWNNVNSVNSFLDKNGKSMMPDLIKDIKELFNQNDN